MDNDRTTKINIETEHSVIKKVIEKAIYEASRRIQEGSAVLPAKQDNQKALIAVTEILTNNSPLGHTAEQTQQLVDIYMYTLAQSTSAMIHLFEIDSTVED